MFSFVIDKPPDNPRQRQWYFKRKQQYTRFLRFYGNSLVGGTDQAKIITVTDTGTSKKTGKNKQGKMVSFDKEPCNNIGFPKYLGLSVKDVTYFLLFLQSKKAAEIIKANKRKAEGLSFIYNVVQARLICLIINFEKMFKYHSYCKSLICPTFTRLPIPILLYVAHRGRSQSGAEKDNRLLFREQYTLLFSKSKMAS